MPGKRASSPASSSITAMHAVLAAYRGASHYALPGRGTIPAAAPGSSARLGSRKVRQLERERQAARDLLQLLFVGLLRALLGGRHGREHEVLEHLDVAADHTRIDLDLADLAPAIRRRGDDATARGPRDR